MNKNRDFVIANEVKQSQRNKGLPRSLCSLAMTSAFICVQIIIFFSLSSFAFSEEIKPICDREYFPAVHSLLKKAKKSIYLIMHQIRYYDSHPRSSANLFCKDLIAAASRGVKVKVIIEQSDLEMFSDSSKKNRDVGYRLAKGGVTVYFDPSETTTHCKLLIVDKRYTVIGSTNWSYYALDKNYESSVLIESEKTANYFIKYFEKLRKKCPIKLSPK